MKSWDSNQPSELNEKTVLGQRSGVCYLTSFLSLALCSVYYHALTNRHCASFFGIPFNLLLHMLFLDSIAFLKRTSDVFPALRHTLTLRFDENSLEPQNDDQTPVSHVSSPALASTLPDQNTCERRRFSFGRSQRKSQHANHEGKGRRLVSSILVALYIRRGHAGVA